MTRKRFVKLMMAYGLDRNKANDFSKIFRRINMGYFDLYRSVLTMNNRLMCQTSTDTVTEKRKEGAEDA